MATVQKFIAYFIKEFSDQIQSETISDFDTEQGLCPKVHKAVSSGLVVGALVKKICLMQNLK